MYHVFLGIRDIQPKTEKQLLRYMHRKGLQTDNNYYLHDSLVNESYIDATLKNKIRWLEVYDKNGYLLTPYDTGKCPGPFYLYLQTICNHRQDADTNALLATRMEQLRPFTTTTNPIDVSDKSYEYTVVIFWARFIGAYNKVNARSYERILKQQQNCKIRYIKVPIDPVQSGQ